MEKDSKIYVAGHRGLLGSAIERTLRSNGYDNLVLRTSEELDLRDQGETRKFFRSEKPEYVFLAAARVGGLQANDTQRGRFIRDNLQIQTNVIDEAYKWGVNKLIFVSSNCVYPKDCGQPMVEEDIMKGRFEPTNQPFAVAKMAGMEMCDAYNREFGTNFVTVIPASLYGPGDNYDLINSHIVPTLIRKCQEAKLSGEESVKIPGSGDRVREMIYVDDAADACLFLMLNYNSSQPINAGTGNGNSIEEIAEKVRKVVGFEGAVLFDESKKSGMMTKVLDSLRINLLGWQPRIDFEEGLQRTYQAYQASIK